MTTAKTCDIFYLFGEKEGEVLKKKNHFAFAIILLAAALFVLSPLFPAVSSLAVMSVYSRECEKASLLNDKGIFLQIPGGGSTAKDDWYPFVMTFCDDEGFSRYIGEPDSRLTILYNFPAFSYSKGCSRLFDESSPYYNGFYGAYLVETPDEVPYGFDGATGELRETAITDVARYDFFKLVLEDFGLKSTDKIFEYSVTDKRANQTFVGYDGWTRVDATITVNGAAHNSDGFVQSYIQYGKPNFPTNEPFKPTTVYCVAYARYFEEWDTSVFFYAMSADRAATQECVVELLGKSVLKQSLTED